MKNFEVAVDENGVAIVTFDMPGRSLNTISSSVLADLEALIPMIQARADVVGAVLVSGKDSGLCAGADLRELIADISRWAPAQSQDELRTALLEASTFSRRIRELETAGKPVAVVIEGVALGGGLELALGCHHRILVDDERLRLGLPEATLGLMPGAGGTQRLVRLAGLNRSLPFLLDGGVIGAPEALEIGVAHELSSRDEALGRAKNWVLQQGVSTAPWDVKGFSIPEGGPHSSLGYATFAPMIAARRGSAVSGPDATILKAVYEGSQVPIDAALRIESRYFLNLVRAPAAAVRIDAFLNR